jgi:hypothetical protein
MTMIFVTCAKKYLKCDTHDMLHTVTQCETPAQKVKKWLKKHKYDNQYMVNQTDVTYCDTVPFL